MNLKRQQPEKAEQRAILDLLKLVHAEVWVLGHPSPADGRTHRGTGQTPGLPDLIACIPRPNARAWSELVMIEIKAPAGRMSKGQVRFEAACIRAEIAYLVGGVDAVLAWLRARGHRV